MKKTVWQMSDGVGMVFVALQPPLGKEVLEKIQTTILEHVKETRRFALAGKIGQRKGGVSYFKISTPHPWPGLKKAVEIGLKKGLKELKRTQSNLGKEVKHGYS